jgi:hypothetical protein
MVSTVIYYKPFLVSSKNSCFSNILTKEVAMDKVYEVKVSVGNAGEENEMEAHIPQVQLEVVAAKADVTQQKGILCVLYYKTTVSVKK